MPLTSLLAAFGCCMQFMYYTILASRLASRFVTILGKKWGPKSSNHWRKTEIEASLDLILIWWKERELLQRERGKRSSEKALWKGNANLAWERQNRALTYNQMRSRPVPHGPFLLAACDVAPHDAAPHISTETVNLTGILLSGLLLRVSDKGLEKTEKKLTSWGKRSTTNDLRARK
jgi:hypothetical protein